MKALLFLLLILAAKFLCAQNTHKQANTTGSEITPDAPYHMQLLDNFGNINPLPIHVFVHASSCAGCNNELMNIVIRIKNASDTEFTDTVLFDDLSDSEFNSLFINKSETNIDFGIQSFDESLSVKSSEYTIDFTSDSHSLPATTYTDITEDYWWFTLLIPAEKLQGYDNIIDLEVYCELDWDPDYVCYMRVFRQNDEFPSLPNWLRGDTHYHGMFTQNDAEVGLPLDATKEMAKHCGLDWITITDHSCDFDNYGDDLYSNWNLLGNIVSQLNSEPDSFTFIRGIEMTIKNSADDQIHALTYPSAENPYAMPYIGDGDGDISGTSVNVEMLSDSLVHHQAFAYAAHPFSQGDELSFAVDGSVWNLGDAEFPENDQPHEYFGSVICNDIAIESDVFSTEENKLLKDNIIGGQIWNLYSNFITEEEQDDAWDVMYSGDHGFELFPEDDNLNTTNRLMQNFEVTEFIWNKGLAAKNNNALLENWKYFITAGSDAHGSFNYSTTDFFMGVSGQVTDNAIGKLSSLTYCPDGAGENGENVLKALENGNVILSSGPIVAFEIDTDSENLGPEIIIGNDTALNYNLYNDAVLKVFSASSDEYGTVDSEKLIIMTETQEFIVDIPSGSPVWEINLSDLIQQVFGSADALLNQWFLIRAELKTSISYFETDIYRCSGKEFYSYTNPVWLKINSPNLTPESLVENDFTIFPNPATDKITIKSTSELILGNLLICNELGEIVKEQQISGDCEIDISGLDSGVYFVKIKTTQSAVTQKLVVY